MRKFVYVQICVCAALYPVTKIVTSELQFLWLIISLAGTLLLENIFYIFISSRPEVFCRKGVLSNFAKFTGKHLCQSLFFNKVADLNISGRLYFHCISIPYSMSKNYWQHQIGIREVVQLNSNKHGFKSTRSLLFYKEVFLKFCRIHMKTPETCTSNKKKLHCWCFLMNFAKFLRTLFYRTPPHGCYWIFFIH